MRLFRIDNNDKFQRFEEEEFNINNKEIDLEDLLENNPEYFFENEKILIIGRQVPTNLKCYIDILGVDINGNSVVIELKRDKTPRDTLAQILEYASYVDNLDYLSLDEIFSDYIDEEISLENYHDEFFSDSINEKASISWNKKIRMIIIAQEITPDIKQTTVFLRKKGIDIFCLEFKYFSNDENDRIISSDYIVGYDDFLKQNITTTSVKSKTDENKFLNSLDSYGVKVFKKILEFGRSNDLLFRWGKKGFSLNFHNENGFTALIFGYPPDSIFKQSIYSGFEEIRKKILGSDQLVNYYQSQLKSLDYFVSAGNNMKWVIDREYNDKHIDKFISLLSEMLKRFNNAQFK